MTRSRPKLGIIAIAVYLVATPAAAAEFTRRPQANGPDVIAITCDIEPGDDKKFIEIASDLMQARVILDSNGGNVEAALTIGRFIHPRNYDTMVLDGAVCNSACAFIWLAGTFRHLDRHARLGLHSIRKSRWLPYERYDAGNATAAAYMAEMGVPQQVIELQPKADPCCLNYVDYIQAQAWGLLSQAKQQALPKPQLSDDAAICCRSGAKPGSIAYMSCRQYLDRERQDKSRFPPTPSVHTPPTEH